MMSMLVVNSSNWIQLRVAFHIRSHSVKSGGCPYSRYDCITGPSLDYSLRTMN